jgi:hypothetical protein
MATLIAVY